MPVSYLLAKDRKKSPYRKRSDLPDPAKSAYAEVNRKDARFQTTLRTSVVMLFRESAERQGITHKDAFAAAIRHWIATPKEPFKKTVRGQGVQNDPFAPLDVRIEKSLDAEFSEAVRGWGGSKIQAVSRAIAAWTALDLNDARAEGVQLA